MQSKIEEALSFKFPPLAIFYAKEAPAEAKELHPLCSMLLLTEAVKGATVALTRGSCGCPGASYGFGLEELDPDHFPGGRDCYFRFLSIGNQDWERGRAVIDHLKKGGAPKIMIEEFSEGEGFLKTPELVEEFTGNAPDIRPEGPWVVIKPLENLGEGEKPKVVAFLANPDQLSALVGLVHFSHPGVESVRVPFGAGCQCLGLYPFYESDQYNPRAIIGLMDISARFYLHKSLGGDILSFTVPFELYEEMEANAPESFLSRFAWKTLMRQA
jgi:uncharacterized protein (DUF169 family)